MGGESVRVVIVMLAIGVWATAVVEFMASPMGMPISFIGLGLIYLWLYKKR